MDNRLILISQTISFLETVHAVIIVFVASDEIDLIEVEISKIFSQKKNNFPVLQCEDSSKFTLKLVLELGRSFILAFGCKLI